jgi:cytochrome c oxidase assembly factor CtaG
VSGVAAVVVALPAHPIPAGQITSGTSLPPFTVGQLFGDWTVAVLPLLVLVALGAAYAAGLRVLSRRGDSWPWARAVAWYAGLVVVAFALMSGLATYDTTLLSVHMGQHLLLNMVAPLPLALAAPVTLALRTLPPRPRAWLLRALHWRVSRVLTHPGVALAIFIGSMYALYLTPLYGETLRHPWLHDAMHVHFLLSGCLFAWVIVGVDPVPGRPSHMGRILTLLAAMPFHAFLGVALLSGSTVLGNGWYEAQHRTWGASPLSDQHTGAGIMWTAGELIGLALLLSMVAQWMKADERASRRSDRQADRDDDAELTAYNNYLASLSGAVSRPE